MSKAKQGDTVHIHYTGKLNDGMVFDSSKDHEPLEFVIGKEEVIPGFENAVLDMEVGQSKTFTVVANEAYGPHHEEMILKIEKERLPEDIKPEVGQHLQARRPDGGVMNFMVVDVSEKEVTLDANHPLAGRDLTFEIELVSIKE
jgi:peptidylprolyl isomerase